MDVVKTKKSGGFESMGLQPGVFRAIKMKGYNVPTPIQRKSIPLIMAGYDIVACSKTGSGKTAAFIIPMVNKLLNHSTTVGVRGLLVLPTRELALQTASVLKTFIKYTDLEYSLLVGGHGFEGQFESLAKNPDILICTPGRIVQHLLEGRLQLSRVQLVIYDEADFLFDMGMADQLKTVLNYLPPTKQSLIFSATIPEQLSMFASVGLKDYIYVKLDSEFFLPETMKLNFLLVSNEHKLSALIYLVGMVEDRCIVFASTRYLVDLIVFALAKFEISAVNIYGKMDQQDRKEQLDSFKYSDAKVLVVTDLASRGIDIPFVSNVIHYDYPAKPKIFIHRSGRTARAGRMGTVYSLIAMEEIYYIQETMLYAGRKLVTEGDLEDTTKAFYGSVPIELIMENQARIFAMQEDQEYMKLYEMAKNANMRFRKTRGSSKVKKQKSAIDVHVVHLMFRKLIQVDDETRNMLNQIKEFKPMQSYIEIKRLQESGKKDPFLKAVSHLKHVQAKPKIAKIVIPKQSESIRVADFTDNRFFIPTQQDIYKKSEFDDIKKITMNDINAFVLADDNDGLRNSQKVNQVWDPKKKKYSKPHKDKDDRAMNVEKGKKSYQKWQKQSQMQIQQVGEEEDKTMIFRAKETFKKRQMRAKGYHFNEEAPANGGYSEKTHSGKGKGNRRNEIKNTEQLVKVCPKIVKQNRKLRNMGRQEDIQYLKYIIIEIHLPINQKSSYILSLSQYRFQCPFF